MDDPVPGPHHSSFVRKSKTYLTFFLDFVDQPRQKYFEEEEVSSGASVSSSRRPQQPPKPPLIAHAQVAQVIGRPLPQYPDYSRKVSNTASIHSIKPASHQLKKSSII